MRFCITLLILLLSQTTIQSQRSLIFEEYFDDNYLMWMTGSNSEYEAEVKEGSYNISYKQDRGVWYFWQSIPIHPDTSFFIESKITPLMNTKESVYGIIWGVNDVNNYNAYMVSSMGMASVATCRGGRFTKVIDWKKAGNYQNNQVHTLGIRNKGGQMHYYLDGKKVLTSSPLPFYGPLTGFVISGKTTAKIDYLRVQQDRQINLIENAIRGYHKENLGSNINSDYSELHPLISHDGKSLFVTRKGHPENKGIDKRDDAWVSYKQKDGSWSKIIRMAFPINNNNHNHIISVSPDNNTLLLGNTYYKNGNSKGKGISMSHKQEDGSWEVPKEVIIDNYYNQNPIHSMHLSSDKRLLLLSIERNDSYGHLDLYISFLQKNGRFTQPKNLGKTINTRYEDGTPFLAADGKTLYFSSAGHGGYGSTDIFVSRRLDDTWRNWTSPENLGPEVNSNVWEGHYSISASGAKAYLVSNRGKDHIGAEDVYRITPPESSKPEPVLMVAGKVYNAKTLEPIRAKIYYYELENNKEVGDALSNGSDGKYQIILPSGNNYSFLSFKGGYYPISEKLEVGKMDNYKEITVDLFLFPIEEGETIPLNNLFYDDATEALLRKSEPELERLNIFLKKYPEMNIEILGPTKIKTQNIKKYLTDKGVEEKRISTQFTNNNEQSKFKIISLSKQDKNIERKGNFNVDIDPDQLKKGQIYRLSNTYFKADSIVINNNAFKELESLKNFLIKNTTVIIEIGGHTNSLPDDSYCDELSENRAKMVANYLTSGGISSRRIQYKGYGKRQAIATNETLQGRQLNQRVEIRILRIGQKSTERRAEGLPSGSE